MRSLFLLPFCMMCFFSEVAVSETVNEITSPAGSSAKSIPVVQRQVAINALLIREITSGNYGAMTSKLTASVTPADGTDSPMVTQMDQEVGESMNKSFAAVNKGLFLKYNGWPKGENLTVVFADKHGGKDGPSAAVAYSLLLESIFSGNNIREDVACTGDMNSDRSVQPIGGVIDKIRAAKKAGCNYVLIPEKNVPSVMDAAIDGDIDLLTSIQIISIKNLDEAIPVAFEAIDEDVNKALLAYKKVQKAVDSNGVAALKRADVFKEVAKTGRAMKNHQSAIIAARYKLNKLPKTYSVVGSFNRLDKAVYTFTSKEHRLGSVSHSDHNDDHKVAIKKLSRIRSKIHPKMTKYAKRVKDYIEVHREIMKHKNGINADGYLHKEYKKALELLKEEQKKMYEDPEIKDNLMQ